MSGLSVNIGAGFVTPPVSAPPTPSLSAPPSVRGILPRLHDAPTPLPPERQFSERPVPGTTLQELDDIGEMESGAGAPKLSVSLEWGIVDSPLNDKSYNALLNGTLPLTQLQKEKLAALKAKYETAQTKLRTNQLILNNSKSKRVQIGTFVLAAVLTVAALVLISSNLFGNTGETVGGYLFERRQHYTCCYNWCIWLASWKQAG